MRAESWNGIFKQGGSRSRQVRWAFANRLSEEWTRCAARYDCSRPKAHRFIRLARPTLRHESSGLILSGSARLGHARLWRVGLRAVTQAAGGADAVEDFDSFRAGFLRA